MKKKNFKNQVVLVVFLSLVSLAAIAQPKLEWGESIGKIITKDGKTIDCIVNVSPESIAKSPWEVQKEFKYIPMDVFKTLTTQYIKKKDYEELKASEVKSLFLNDTLQYESVEYADMSAVSLSMGKQVYLLRKLAEGKINLYKFHQTPPAVGVYSEGEYKKLMDHCKFEPDYIIYKIGDKKAKNSTDTDLETYINDSPTILEKYRAGAYGNPKKSEEDGGMKKLIKKSIEQSKSLGYIQKLIIDYNQSF